MVDDATWKRRFYLFMGARVFGALTFLAGIAIAFTDLVRDGGWSAVGAVIAIVGVVDAVIAPKLLKKRWERDDKTAAE